MSTLPRSPATKLDLWLYLWKISGKLRSKETSHLVARSLGSIVLCGTISPNVASYSRLSQITGITLNVSKDNYITRGNDIKSVNLTDVSDPRPCAKRCERTRGTQIL